MIVGLRLEGIMAPMILDGANNGEMFTAVTPPALRTPSSIGHSSKSAISRRVSLTVPSASIGSRCAARKPSAHS